MLNHHIGKEIVIGNAAVFIRALAEQQVRPAKFRAIGIAADPETGRLDINFRRFFQIEFAVPGGLTVGIQSIGHVSCDVQLAASNIPGFALLAAVQSSHPGVSGSGSIHPFGMLFRCWQRTGTVIAEAFCGLQIIF